ncbi:FtsX-like permease family protein [Duganella sp. FT92W]|uniref:FtsX-like permease family protein n=1 Tax=Pseudoduganella rivuli TaxID=2666085 RepID=A0A7X2IJK7_9BURK|nr:ABC transporter permease [Pseudoduganella rivuli]MRV70703.1 FtsX-like permease family protein [Pseudoduganella rivuli]
MKLRDFRIGWRLLLQERAYSIVSIAGLAVGLAACFLLLGFVRYCLDYNSHVPDAARVYAIKQRINVFPRPEWAVYAGLPLRDAALASGMVEQAAIMREMEMQLVVERQRYKAAVDVADPAAIGLLGLRPLQGDLPAALTRPDGLALTQELARKLFGAEPALGRSVKLNDSVLQVLAVVADAPANSTMPYEALIGTASTAWPDRADYRTNLRRRGSIYLRLKPGADPGLLAQQLQSFVNQHPSEVTVRTGPLGQNLNGRNVTDIALAAMPDLYFDAELAAGRYGSRYGNRGSMLALAAVAGLILLLAAANYVNLATVRTLRRQREVAMRKLLGASPARLVMQFLAESSLVAMLATAAGLVLVWLCLPAFAALVNRKLDSVLSPANCAAALALGLLVGLCAGAYPAWIALRVRPAVALAGRGDSETAAGLWLRRALTVLQFSVAMALTATTVAIAWQTDYANHADRGFNPDGLLVLDLPTDSGQPAAADFLAALARLPGVHGVNAMSEAVGRDDNMMTGVMLGRHGDAVRMELRTVSPEFFSVYGLKPLYGRLFDKAQDPPDAGKVVLNVAAALALGFATPQDAVGQRLGEQLVIGIAPEVRYQSLRQLGQPLAYIARGGAVASLRADADVATMREAILPLWQRYFPEQDLELRSAASMFGLAYQEDAQLARMLAAASLIAVVLAACGIYVLSAYSVQRRRREIVLRKLHGAGRAAIVQLVGREFAALLGAGALLGLPPAAMAIRQHLGGFVEHAPLGLWPLAGALLLAMLVALAATARHTLTALRLSPAAALRG